MGRVEIKSAAEIVLMREAGRIVCEVLDALERAVVPGISTGELDALAEKMTLERGAVPAFKGYHGFPASICASVNHEVVHGIPSPQRKLSPGDLLKIDFGVSYQGWFGDAARTVPVGAVTPQAQALMQATRESLARAVAVMVAGNRVGDIGDAVQRFVEARGYSVVRAFSGHGIGKRLHEDPSVPNHGSPGAGVRLRPGMVLAVEPMVNAGTEQVDVLEDGWTAVTADRRLSAHFEHTILVTEGAPEILTRSGKGGKNGA